MSHGNVNPVVLHGTVSLPDSVEYAGFDPAEFRGVRDQIRSSSS